MRVLYRCIKTKASHELKRGLCPANQPTSINREDVYIPRSPSAQSPLLQRASTSTQAMVKTVRDNCHSRRKAMSPRRLHQGGCIKAQMRLPWGSLQTRTSDAGRQSRPVLSLPLIPAHGSFSRFLPPAPVFVLKNRNTLAAAQKLKKNTYHY